MPQTCWCSCLPVYQISFFPPHFWHDVPVVSQTFCPCALGVNRDLSIPRCEGEKVSAQHCSPVRGWVTSWSSGLSAWWPPICSQGKNWDGKIFQSRVLIAAHWVEPSSSCCQELSGVGFGSPLAEGRLWCPSQAHSCSGHWALWGCVSSYHLMWAELSNCYFFKCYVVHIPFPVQAELNSQLAGLCWVPLCPHCGFYQVLVFLPETFIQN